MVLMESDVIIKALSALFSSLRYASLSTIDSEGYPHARYEIYSCTVFF
jgi:hypothetical protein